MKVRALLIGLVLTTGPAAAFELNLPSSARRLVERNTDPDRYAAPLGTYVAGHLPKIILEGPVARAAWRLEAPGLTPLQVMQPLRTQLENGGYEVLLDCTSLNCGGFDFRFGTEVLPGPHMYVNIKSFQFLTAVRGATDQPQEAITILASTTASTAYVQIIQAGGKAANVAANGAAPVANRPTPQGDLATTLVRDGHTALDGLVFGTGSSDLGQGPFQSLTDLATFLKSRPKIRIALVGHTDSVGSLDGNIALSKRRAQSVRQRLVDVHGIAAARVDAQGMGYLAPVASNLDEQGRDANRRVEAILLDE